jgi:hypothetical protein
MASVFLTFLVLSPFYCASLHKNPADGATTNEEEGA